jgi:hypothetical protein
MSKEIQNKINSPIRGGLFSSAAATSSPVDQVARNGDA